MHSDTAGSTTLAKEATKEHVGSPRILGLLFDVDGTLYRQGLLHAMMAGCFAAAFLRGPRRTLRELRTVKNYRRAMEQLRTSKNGGRLSPGAQLRTTAAATRLSVQTVEASVHYWMEQAPLMFLSLCARRLVQRDHCRNVQDLGEEGTKTGHDHEARGDMPSYEFAQIRKTQPAL